MLLVVHRQEARGFIDLPDLGDTVDARIQEEICISAAAMADKLKVRAPNGRQDHRLTVARFPSNASARFLP